MRLRDLERTLSSIAAHPAPKAELEQYTTPGDLAARLLAEASALGDIGGKRVVDLGCGTGVLAIGAQLLGAASVVGIDVDEASLAVARTEAARIGAEVEFIAMDVSAWPGSADTVIMNPPFGAQRPGADRPFLDAAFAHAAVVYSLHNAMTRAFVEAYARDHGFAVTNTWLLKFPLRQQYRHQSRSVADIDVLAFRMEKRV
ncbi:MAG: METTL5 family protein [Candidatus Thermoplasmatota archaeon]